MSILAWIIFGALAGWLASIITGRNASQGAIGNIIVGIIGAFLGGILFNLFGAEGVEGFNLYSLVVAIIGATVLLWIVNMFSKSGHRTH